MLKEADIRLNGDRAWDIQVHDERLYDRVVHEGTLGLGEAYMDGWWDCQCIDEMICKAIRAGLEKKVKKNWPALTVLVCANLFNLQSKSRASMVAEQHYNFGNDMFEYMLGPSMNYSCGYWKNAKTLDEAENVKMALICKKLQLKPGMKVLEIGFGWGALSRYMAKNCGVEVTGINVSTEQLAYAKAYTENLPITWLLEDYRSIQGQFDRIVSVGMFEHVGPKNFDVFFDTTLRVLKPDGLFLLHTIGSCCRMGGTDAWINKYIFPNGVIPSMEAITKSLTNRYILEDWHNFGADYDKTLMAWEARFTEGLEKGAFTCTERQQRMFKYYLLICAGAFRARDLQLWQIMLSPHGVPGGYDCRNY